MNIFDKLKSYFSKEEPDCNEQNEQMIFEMINSEIFKFYDFLPEIRSIGKDHYKIKETEEDI